MCRTDVTPEAAPALAALLDDMAHALAADFDLDRALVKIGPVDFGAVTE